MKTPRAVLEATLHRGIPDRETAEPLLSPATQLPFAAMSRRRFVNVAVFFVVAVIAAALGYSPWEVPVIVLVWLGGLWLVARTTARVGAKRALSVETISYCFNAALLTFACYYLGGATWLAGTFYMLLVLVASAGLPRARALLVAGVVLAGFSFLAIAPAVGVIELPPFGPPNDRPSDLSFAILTVIIQAVALALVVFLQQWLVGTMRAAASGSRALVEASTDLVAVLGPDGVILGANPAFSAQSVATAELRGARIADVVSESDQPEFERKLADACNGVRAPFKVSYTRHDGGQGWLSGTMVPLPSDSSEPRVLMIARDVTAEHAAAAKDVIQLTRTATALRTKTFERAVADVMREVEQTLEGLRERALSLRSQLPLQADAAVATEIASEAHQLGETARDVLEWIDSSSAREEPR